jgi:molybdopterin converting factor small subunit
MVQIGTPSEMQIKVKLFYHLRERAGTNEVLLEIPDGSSIGIVKSLLEKRYPQLRTHLDNVMILMNQQIVLEDDIIKNDAVISFLTPVGGG